MESSMSQRNTRRATGASTIDIYQLKEAHFWAHKFSCTIEQLRAAVKSVGTDAAAVTNYFLRVAALQAGDRRLNPLFDPARGRRKALFVFGLPA